MITDKDLIKSQRASDADEEAGPADASASL
jgi:hypothetical protein